MTVRGVCKNSSMKLEPETTYDRIHTRPQSRRLQAPPGSRSRGHIPNRCSVCRRHGGPDSLGVGGMTRDALYPLWETHGVNFGYPKCCRLAFCFPDRTDARKFDGTGFVCCSVCNSHSTKFLMEVIQAQRNRALPRFPDYSPSLPLEHLARSVVAAFPWYQSAALPYL